MQKLGSSFDVLRLADEYDILYNKEMHYTFHQFHFKTVIKLNFRFQLIIFCSLFLGGYSISQIIGLKKCIIQIKVDYTD